LIWCALPLAAQEYIQTNARLSDADFYRLVSCAAAPGAECRKRVIFWPEHKRAALSVGYVSKTGAIHPWQERLYTWALEHAVAEINRVGGGITLRVVPMAEGGLRDIALHVVDTRPGGVMQGTGEPALEGRVLPLAQVVVQARGQWIERAVISISVDTPRRAIASVVLEEIVQALGLMTDIRSPVYRKSIFAEDSNSGTRLLGQDAMVIRRHYPPT
jgi:hypothetical protein